VVAGGTKKVWRMLDNHPLKTINIHIRSLPMAGPSEARWKAHVGGRVEVSGRGSVRASSFSSQTVNLTYESVGREGVCFVSPHTLH
jgi:hypothetical protein